MNLSLATIKDLVHETYVALGAEVPDADIVADVLTTADRFGIASHGIQRLGYYVTRIRRDLTRPGARMEVVSETPTTAVIDGAHGLGHVIAHRAMTLAIEKARRLGLGAVAVRNSTHYGIVGYYTLMAANGGQIGIATTNARPCQAPTFGTAPMFGTNPIAFAAPTDERTPFWFDAALSISQRGRVEGLARRNEPLMEGLAIDRDGQPATDPAALLRDLERGEAAMLPLGGSGETTGGHKGYGLSIAMEILCAALGGGSFLHDLGGGDADGTARTYNTGHFFLAIDAAAFGGVETCRSITGDIVRELRGSRRAPGAARIFTAGEREWENAKRIEREGVRIDPALAEELRALRDELGLSPFPELDAG